MRKIETVKADADQGERMLHDDVHVLRDDELDAVSGGLIKMCATGEHIKIALLTVR